MYYSAAKQHFYAADAFLGIGDDLAAIAEAATAVDTYQSGPVEEYNYTDAVITYLTMAIANVRAGDLDAAIEATQAAFQIGAKHRSSNVDKTTRRLHRQLCAAEVRTAPLAIDTRDQIENFLSTTPARPELA
jgi:hypothetical protein